MDKQLKSNLTSSKHWMRLLFMVLFAVILQIAMGVMWLVVVVQFLFALISGSNNSQLTRFSSSLAQYIYTTINFLTYTSEEKTFPFADWPEPLVEDVDDSQVVATAEDVNSVAAPSETAPVEHHDTSVETESSGEQTPEEKSN